MLDGTYELGVDTVLGRLTVGLELVHEDDQLMGYVKAPVVGRQRVRLTADGDSFFGEGSFMLFLQGMVRYELRGTLAGDNLDVTITTNKGDFHAVGERV